jgi:hypothetical protein
MFLVGLARIAQDHRKKAEFEQYFTLYAALSVLSLASHF